VTNQTGMLTHGKMFEKMWDKERRLEKLKTIFDKHANENLIFVAKYAAEVAKEYIQLKKK
jgi:membrane protein DedA with SNARE-associated domain